ncbi:dynein regulation protein LC7 [Sphaerisporangium krabiense]|uniref:Putative regulator of Ras-like GTPase activity (Roadblock/LC7/MglB family) n=1 Tax=Sphaerisporangium krabiense TaxID=763782 RepID=A0A7W8Z1J3_9ACTN|nr:roadblock/LC7 domain-containing protein [Sphaerisporangium krabiense]MBB5625756.1 putative regulator of Ras-like GTPase activity (Roadblock/LC7/MglB family) [Sphaerisporangium krabiense]GII62908.1 dynein regulation protein LC7 [Sphaerisporangium krabiense]
MSTELNWLLDDFVARVTDVRHAIILSNDGLRVAASGGLLREDAEHLSAVAAAFQSLAKGTAMRFEGGAVRQTIVEMEAALLFVSAAGDGSCLAVLSGMRADAGLIAYEMAHLVARMGRHLTTQPRGMT